MKKLFAILSPAYTEVGDTLKDLSSFVINPFHQIMYEQVCGYSLGHEVIFFDNLEDAHNNIDVGIRGSKTDSKAAAQKAIIELDADDEKITGVSKLHTADVRKLYEQADQERFFKAVRIPVWKEQAIDPAQDLTEGAVDELNRQYQECKKTVTAQAS
ncbi:hypothetical protein [Legionella longbeachae]|uniref:Uncharacterized protein n=1 Tax=Legionella longbeachae serogroup 1 (strain NSW150) TaxID=661367 RepID=D3HKB6_LEGLN|nr:hypothetical protein [Legionella longbeachae]VEE03396.1 Uncharacterised protein [Legionella oakridgensis]HBD7397672.1 hypothetical protein [Legionella pneumophila]ARB93710.1 hypothetical protein A6J40_16685 [Legionella longbeachae]ARM33150.1 hypothetical protein B0B39_06280 [Legionella longbeachae]EEZ94001.1 hypothetical protein LLB_2899 [Legionella longbeachae D-4968]